MSHHSGSGGHGGGCHGFGGGGFHQPNGGFGSQGFGQHNYQQHESNYFRQRQNQGGYGTNGGGCEGLRHEAWGGPPNRNNAYNRSRSGGYDSRNNPGNYGGGFGNNGFGGGDNCPPYSGQDGYQPPYSGQDGFNPPYSGGDARRPNGPEQPDSGVGDYHNPQNFENPFSDLEQAKEQYLSNGIDAARPAYQRAINAADALNPGEIRHDLQRNQQREAMLNQQEQMMQRNGASPQDLQAMEQQRRNLLQQDRQLQQLYLAPGIVRANFGMALIASGDVSEGEKMVQEALRLRPEMGNDPRFQRSLQDARRRGGEAAGGNDRDPYKYGGDNNPPLAPPAPGRDTGRQPPFAPPAPGRDPVNPPYAPTPPRADQPLPTPPGADHPLPTPPGADRPLPTPPGADQPLPTPPGADQPSKPGDPKAGNPSTGGGGADQPRTPRDDDGPSLWQWLLGATGLAAAWVAMKQYAEKVRANEKLKTSFEKDGTEFSDDRPFKAEKQTKAGEVEIEGKKVKFEEGDYIVTGPDGKKQVLKGKDFDARFQSTGKPGEYKDTAADKVNATKLTEETTYVDRNGKKQTAKAGDYLVTRPDGTQESVSPQDFAARYSSTGKNAEFEDTVKAARLFQETTYTGADGKPHTAKAGDYMVFRPDGSRESFTPKEFSSRFERAGAGANTYTDMEAQKVTATKLTQDTTYQDASGKPQTAKVGDYMITNADGSQQSLDARKFESRFQATGQGEYTDSRALTIRAKKMTVDTKYLDADGRAQTAKAGEWLVLKDGKLSSVKNGDFTKGFQQSDQAPAAAPNSADTAGNGGSKSDRLPADTDQKPTDDGKGPGTDDSNGGGTPGGENQNKGGGGAPGGENQNKGDSGAPGGDNHNKDAAPTGVDQPAPQPAAAEAVAGIKMNQTIKLNGRSWQVSGADGDAVILRSGTDADIIGNKLTKLDPAQFHEIKVDGMQGTFYRRNLKSSQDVYMKTDNGMVVRVNDLQVRGANSDVVDALRQGKSEYTPPVRARQATPPADPAPETKINVGLSDSDVRNYLDYVGSNATAGSADYLSQLSDAAKGALTNEFGWGQNGGDAYLGQALAKTNVVASDDLQSGSRLVVKDKSGAEIKIKDVVLDPANPAANVATTETGAKVNLSDLTFEIQVPRGASAADAARETLVRFSELKSRLTPADQLARTSSTDVTPQDFDARVSALQKPADGAAPTVSPEIASAANGRGVEINLNVATNLKVTVDGNGISIGNQLHSNVEIADQALKQAQDDLTKLQQSGEDPTTDAYKGKLAQMQKNITDLQALRPKLVAGDPEVAADVRGAMTEDLPDVYGAAEGGRVPEGGAVGGKATVYLLLVAAAASLLLQYKKDNGAQTHVPAA